jgi:alkanesulfonate monooxygenase SsuD/methylene tetrahydromethanopterin reductase-like flavin-dependent oxidoreductase (luciferase family)
LRLIASRPFTPRKDGDAKLNGAESLSLLLDRMALADKAGLDVFGIGEHHRSEFLNSAPVVILAAAAARTTRIHLTSAVTVLSAVDPVRAFQNCRGLSSFWSFA